MMKFKGFSLSEVLITITIIGVVATLTLPALNANVQRQQAGPALLRAIATLDTANSLMFVEQDMMSFGDSCANYVTDCFEPFIRRRMGADNGTNTGINYSEFISQAPGGVTHGGSFGTGYTTNNGFIYYFQQNGSNVNVRIDINGEKGPNMVGRDLFFATISADDDGKVYAFGSRAAREINEITWEGGNCDTDGVADARTCAGSIIDHGGSVAYRW